MDLLMNLTCWINTYTTRIAYLPGVPDYFVSMFENFPQLARISQFLTTFFFHAQSLSTIAICAHRLSSAKYTDANKYWNRYYLLVYLAILVFSYLVTNLLNFQEIYFDYENKMFQMKDDITVDQHHFNRIYLFCTFIFYSITIMLVGFRTLHQVREKLADHADQHVKLIRRLSKLAVAHTLFFSLYLFWLLSTFVIPYYIALELLTVVTDVVAFSMTYMLLIFDSNVHKVLKRILPAKLTRGSVNDVQLSSHVSLSTITICAHRLSSAKYVDANKYWSRYYLLVYLGIVVYSFSMTIVLNFQEIYFDYEVKVFRIKEVTVEQGLFNGVYLFCIFSFYSITIMIVGSLTLQQVREKLADHADQHVQLIRRLSKLAVAHTLFFSLYLFWLLSTFVTPFYFAIEALTVVTDVVAFSMTYMLLIFDTNVHRFLKRFLPARLARGSVNDVHLSSPVVS
ncbi:unnamed protein product [Caenorhabditis brenneri]